MEVTYFNLQLDKPKYSLEDFMQIDEYLNKADLSTPSTISDQTSSLFTYVIFNCYLMIILSNIKIPHIFISTLVLSIVYIKLAKESFFTIILDDDVIV